MKKIFIALFCCVALASCTFHSGIITPANVVIQENNFNIVKTIHGSASATYILLIGGNDKKGLVNEAKKDLYSKHKLTPSQTITNLTFDVSRQFILGSLYYKQICYISADVIDFNYSKTTSAAVSNFNGNRAREKSVITNKDKDGFVSGPHENYFKGELIIFKIGDDFFKATITEDSGERGFVTVDNIFEKINSDWVLKKNKSTFMSIAKSYIQSKQTP